MKFGILFNNKIHYSNENNEIKIYSKLDSNKILGSIFYMDNININSIYEESIIHFQENKFNKLNLNINKIKKFKQLLINNKTLIINLLIHSIFKNYNDALDEFNRSIKYIDLCIKYAKKIIFKKQKFNLPKLHKKAIYTYESLGNILLITPFNYPLNLAIIKIIPGLLTNNHIIFKPASDGVLIGIKLCELLYEAGFNNYQLNCIVLKNYNEDLITNQTIKLINFTGSTQVGRLIQKLNPYANHNLEMSGNDIAIVDKDCDINNSVNSIIKGAFSYNGQRCTAIKRLLVHDNIYNHFIDLLNKKVSTLSVGSCINNSQITELIKSNLATKIKSYYNEGKSKQEINYKNNILSPIVLYDVNVDSLIWKQEQFMPILPVVKFSNHNEAIKIANNTEYGLQASLYTNNKDIINQYKKNLEVGTLNVNSHPSRGPDILPFFGIKKSGKGYQGLKNNFLIYLQLKGLVFNW